MFMSGARKSIENVLDGFYNFISKSYIPLIKLNYKYVLIIGMLSPVILILISISLYTLTEPFSIFTHYISDLGIGPNGSNIFFSLAMFFGGFFMLLISLFLYQLILKVGADKIIVFICLISSFISVIGIVFVGVFPVVYMQEVHNFFANMIFYGASINTICLLLIELRLSRLPRYLPISTIILLSINLIFTSLTLLKDLIGLPLGDLVRFLEWMTAIITIIWILIHNLFTFTPEVRNIIKIKYKI